MSRFGVVLMSGAIHAYRLVLRPMLPAACRFEPSCSEYCLQALAGHGVVRGLSLAVRRIGRCHPWHPGGFDPIPGADPSRGRSAR